MVDSGQPPSFIVAERPVHLKYENLNVLCGGLLSRLLLLTTLTVMDGR